MDYLEEAKQAAHQTNLAAAEGFKGADAWGMTAIAYALIALVERLDLLIDKDMSGKGGVGSLP
jgi:hypothetical protein